MTGVTGGNGVGKSNVYPALALLQRMAEGRFAEALASEGGMPSTLWAGKRRKDETRRISWGLEHMADLDFERESKVNPPEIGQSSTPTAFHPTAQVCLARWLPRGKCRRISCRGRDSRCGGCISEGWKSWACEELGIAGEMRE